MKKVILFLLAICTIVYADAQGRKKIKKGRRNKSGSNFALHKNDFQAEWEIGREIINPQLTTAVYPNLVLHYGLSDRIEVNTEMSLLTVTGESESSKKSTTGIEAVLIGGNYLLLKETDKRPSIILSAQLGIPFLATKNFAADHLAPVVQVTAQQAVHKDLVFGVSSGLLWDGFSTTPDFIYNVTASYTFIKKWMLTGECFGFVNQEPPQNNLDASIAYLVNDYVQFGFVAGVGITAAAHKNYFAINGTWGFNTAKKKHAL